MHKLLIIDDSDCKEALDNFLQVHQKDILLFMEEKEFNQCFDKVIHDLNEFYKMQRKIVLKISKGIQKVAVSDIIYARNLKKTERTVIHLKSGRKLEVHLDLKTLENEVKDFSFVSVNEEFLVNVDCMSEYIPEKGSFILMENGERISVDPARETELLELLNDWK